MKELHTGERESKENRGAKVKEYNGRERAKGARFDHCFHIYARSNFLDEKTRSFG